MKKILLITCLAAGTATLAADRPELTAYPYKEAVTAAGTYEASTAGMNYVISGSFAGDVTVTASEDCRVTLSGVTISEGVLTIYGNAQLWLEGANSITTTNQSAIVVSDTLTIGGSGTLAATAAGAKKVGVIATTDLVLAGGETTLTISSNTKNACGALLTGNYTQLAGTLKVVSTQSKKSNGVYLSKKKTTATISGGTLDISLAGEKSAGLAIDKDSSQSITMTGGVIKLAMSGDGAKGVKGDGSFTMSGGVVDATITGGYVEELLEYEDADEVAWNFYITLDSSSTTTGNSSAGSDSLTVATSTMIANGTYPVYDPSKAYGIKVGTLNVSDGLIRIRCTGTCGRGIGADSMYLSGGVYDISVAGGPTDVYVESLIDVDDDAFDPANVQVCLDSGGAACLKSSGTNGVMSITGGTFELLATGTAGKLINAGGYLVIGAEGSSTLPTDSSFSPDIQGQALGEKVFCTYYKQKYYGSLGTAVATTNLDESACSVAADNIVEGTHDDVDYSNPKGAKAESGVTVNGGRVRFYTANDGGEGLESKDTMTINGGLVELNCADDCINTGDDLTINGGYIYAASTGNDAVDSNGNITINDGWIYAFTLSNPEEAFDVNSSYSVTINGGYLFGIGAAQSCRDGTLSGTQGWYQGSYTLPTTATYLMVSGTDTVYGKIPAAGSSSTAYLVCSAPGMSTNTAPTSAGTTAPSANSVGFHGFYTTGDVDSGSSSSGDDSGSSSGGDSGTTTTSGNFTTDGTLSYTYQISSASSASFTYAASYIASESANYVLSNATITVSDSNTLGLLAANGAQVTLVNCTINKTGDGSGQSNEDNYNFYGINNAIVALGSSTKIVLDGCTVTTDAAYANGVFASDNGTITITNGITVTTSGDSSRGLFASYGGTVQAPDGGVHITTTGSHCASLVTDCGGGTIICGASTSAAASTVSTQKNDSPCIYSTGTISGYNITGSCANGQAVVVEGDNIVALNGCALSGGRNGTDTSDQQGCIFLYQSGSGDAASSDASSTFSAFYATNCTFTAANSAHMFVCTHTTAKAYTSGCTFYAGSNSSAFATSDASQYLISCTTVNSSQWGDGNYLTLVTDDDLTGTVYVGDSTSTATITCGSGSTLAESNDGGTITISK